jgi:hypothetical protein
MLYRLGVGTTKVFLQRGYNVVAKLFEGNQPGPVHGVDVDDQGNETAVEQRMYQVIRRTGRDVDRQQVAVPCNRQTIERDLGGSLSRAYRTALSLLGDEARAEALVIEAIGSLESEDLTSDALRNAVVKRLVHEQMRQPQMNSN